MSNTTRRLIWPPLAPAHALGDASPLPAETPADDAPRPRVCGVCRTKPCVCAPEVPGDA